MHSRIPRLCLSVIDKSRIYSGRILWVCLSVVGRVPILWVPGGAYVLRGYFWREPDHSTTALVSPQGSFISKPFGLVLAARSW